MYNGGGEEVEQSTGSMILRDSAVSVFRVFIYQRRDYMLGKLPYIKYSPFSRSFVTFFHGALQRFYGVLESSRGTF